MGHEKFNEFGLLFPCILCKSQTQSLFNSVKNGEDLQEVCLRLLLVLLQFHPKCCLIRVVDKTTALINDDLFLVFSSETTPSSPGEVPVEYSAPPKAIEKLIKSSDFCSQDMSYLCQVRLRILLASWNCVVQGLSELLG